MSGTVIFVLIAALIGAGAGMRLQHEISAAKMRRFEDHIRARERAVDAERKIIDMTADGIDRMEEVAKAPVEVVIKRAGTLLAIDSRRTEVKDGRFLVNGQVIDPERPYPTRMADIEMDQTAGRPLRPAYITPDEYHYWQVVARKTLKGY